MANLLDETKANRHQWPTPTQVELMRADMDNLIEWCEELRTEAREVVELLTRRDHRLERFEMGALVAYEHSITPQEFDRAVKLLERLR